jgi:DNA topoisomerase VI subunit B
MSTAAALQRATFRTSRLLDFATEQSLITQIGHPVPEWPLVIGKELIDNALDAAEESGVAPLIEVTIDAGSITVTDNGPGIPDDVIKDILNFSIRVSSREAYVSPTRGRQGNALKTLIAMPFVLDGEQGHIEIETRGVRHIITMSVNRIEQKPDIDYRREPSTCKNGTKVTIHWPASPRCQLIDTKAHFLQVVCRYPWVNPHMRLAVDCEAAWREGMCAILIELEATSVPVAANPFVARGGA